MTVIIPWLDRIVFDVSSKLTALSNAGTAISFCVAAFDIITLQSIRKATVRHLKLISTIWRIADDMLIETVVPASHQFLQSGRSSRARHQMLES